MHIELTDEDIAIVTPTSNFKGPETIQEARENVILLNEAVQKGGIAALIYLPTHYVNAEATRYYKTYAPNLPAALIADSFFKRMIGNFLLPLANPQRPIKLFSNREEALAWLKATLAHIEA